MYKFRGSIKYTSKGLINNVKIDELLIVINDKKKRSIISHVPYELNNNILKFSSFFSFKKFPKPSLNATFDIALKIDANYYVLKQR